MDMSGIEGIVKAASAINGMQEGDYRGEDGLLYCGKCHTVKQHREEHWLGGGERLLPIQCKCAREARLKREEARRAEERKYRLEGMRRTGFPDAEMLKWTFDADDGMSEKTMMVARNYVDNFEAFKAKGKGLLLFGTVGCGKSFAAACIANELINRGVPCMMTNFSRIVNQLSESFEGRQRYIDRLNCFKLLVIDDLAAERDTEYMWEQVMNVVDSRYRAGLPLIVTTNLTAQELSSPSDVRKARVYSRLLEMCLPFHVEGADRRRVKAHDDVAELRGLLGL